MCIFFSEVGKVINYMVLSKDEERLVVVYDSLVLVLDISFGDFCSVIGGLIYIFYI